MSARTTTQQPTDDGARGRFIRELWMSARKFTGREDVWLCDHCGQMSFTPAQRAFIDGLWRKFGGGAKTGGDRLQTCPTTTEARS